MQQRPAPRASARGEAQRSHVPELYCQIYIPLLLDLVGAVVRALAAGVDSLGLPCGGALIRTDSRDNFGGQAGGAVNAQRQYHIMVVDDEEGIRRILIDLFTASGYRTSTASNGAEALAMIERDTPDMVISDIQMPLMDGFGLFQVLDTRYPSVKRILMTSYDIDQYISLVRKHNIGNILVKGSDFSLGEVSEYVGSLLTGSIFGLDRYFPRSALNRFSIVSYGQAREVCALISKACPQETGLFLEIAIDELISNAVFHGVLELTGVPREQWREDYLIDAEKAISVTWASDSEKIGVAVEDPKGNLKKYDVLRWLDHGNGEPRGPEEHGRGFLLVRKLIDRFIVNIDPGTRTECIVLQYFDRQHLNTRKPLLIHEL